MIFSFKNICKKISNLSKERKCAMIGLKTPIHGGHYSWKLLEFILLLYRVKTEISKIISITEVQINLPHVYKKKV